MRNLDLTTPDDASGDTPDASLITPLPDLVRGVASGNKQPWRTALVPGYNTIVALVG